MNRKERDGKKEEKMRGKNQILQRKKKRKQNEEIKKNRKKKQNRTKSGK